MSKVDLRRESEKHLKNKLGRKHRRDAKLQELERQLEFAESRCGTLKQQLDYIKQLYGCMTENSLKENQIPKEEGHGDGSNVNQFTSNEFSKWNQVNSNLPNREDGDGPELTKDVISHSNSTSTNSSNKLFIREKHEAKKKNPKPKGHIKLMKIKKKSCKKVKKRRKIEDRGSSKVSNASSQTHNQIWQDPVVEIYKNSALKAESESGFEVFDKNKFNKLNEVLSEVLRYKLSSKTSSSQQEDTGDDLKEKSCNSLNARKGANCLKEEGMQTELPFGYNKFVGQNKAADLVDYLNKENTLKTESVYAEPVKNYCQPTISSKRKQVERDIYSNLNNLNIRNIPFIAAKSTAPSHNIGVNIQQVLSIIKKRQPLSENLVNANANDSSHENPLLTLLSSKKIGCRTNETETVSMPTTEILSFSDLKTRAEGLRTSLSHWKSNSEISKEKPNGRPENETIDWSLKVEKLKKVLVFLHEDFTTLSHKYKRLQKKLTKRNITKTDAKDELAGIERDLEKKEEEITVVVALYKEVLNLKEELKKLQEKFNMAMCGRSYMTDGIKQSNSAHIQMTTLLRKIQNFQIKLKG